MNYHTSNHALVGNTPLIEIKNIDTGPCQLFVKMESLNLSGSLKDRMAHYMLSAAEKAGQIARGSTIVEATSGNTALALAHLANLRRYKCLFVVHDKTSKEKKSHLEALGAKVVITSHDLSRDHPEYYQNLAARLAKETPYAFYTNQFANLANPLAYEETLAPEIYQQMQQNVDAIVCGVGTGGHMSGIGHFMQRVSPKTKMILADPQGSILTPYFHTGKIPQVGAWLVEGIGEDCIHPACDFKLINEVITVTDQESFSALFTLLKKEAIFGGTSAGAACAAALRYCRAQTEPKRVVTFIYDSGYKYASKICNEDWLKANGLFDLVGG